MELNIEQVKKTYGKNLVLNHISLQIKSGILGLLGPNGAGKSTLMRIISTIEKADSGTISWNGSDIAKTPHHLRQQLGYLPQDFGVYPNLTSIEFLTYMAALKGLEPNSAKKRMFELLESLNLTDSIKKPLGGFSGGMLQRVGIAQALLNDPALLIVDEPTVGLDPEERIRFRNLLSHLASDRMIIYSTHIVSDIEALASNIAIMKKGQMTKMTTPEELIKSSENKVWEQLIPTQDFPAIQEMYQISSAIHRENGIQIRMISNTNPGNNCKAVSATLEEAYLFHLS